MLKIGDAPADLRDPIPGVGQGHDDVVVDLCQRGSVAIVAQHALPVGITNHAVGTGRILFQPGEQGRPEIKADPRVIVHDADDLVIAINDPRGPIGRIAFRGDAFVPVVVGGGRASFSTVSSRGFLAAVGRNARERRYSVRRDFLVGHDFMIAAMGIARLQQRDLGVLNGKRNRGSLTSLRFGRDDNTGSVRSATRGRAGLR